MEVEKFYKDKNKYEKMELIALKDDKKAKCLYCKKLVGMKFTVEPSRLMAECGAYGSTKGCDYKLVIDKETFVQIDDKLLFLKTEIKQIEENIILVKFNHLFKFETTLQTTEEFDTLKLKLEALKMEYTTILQRKYIPNYNLIVENKTELQRVINEIKNIDNVSEIIDIQNTTIKELNIDIATLSYKHKEIISSKDKLNHRLLTQEHTIKSNEIKV